MSLTPDHPWYWIEQNRQRRLRAVPVGPLAARWIQTVQGRAMLAGRIARVIGPLVDAEFRTHCTLGPVASGRLTILVDETARVHAMRVKWLFVLRQHLLSSPRDIRIHHLDFKLGRSELGFQVDSLVAGVIPEERLAVRGEPPMKRAMPREPGTYPRRRHE